MKSPGSLLDDVRAAAPLVHNITNFVAMNPMANTLLALGASPAMVHAQDEVVEFCALAQALTINIGTADGAWASAMLAAATAMRAGGRPWVLDPVGVAATGFRQALCGRLLALAPTVVRGNASEILALAGAGGRARGVDSGDPVTHAASAARQLAMRTGGVVVATGATDYVTDGTRGLYIDNGHPWMPKVTALGCSLTGVVAAFVAVHASALEATAAALAYYGLAGEIGAAHAHGPGSFQVAFVDALHAISAPQLDACARIRPG